MTVSDPNSCPICAASVVIPPELVIPRTPCKRCKTVVAREVRLDGSPYLIAVDGPSYAKTRVRWQQIHAAKKWGALIFLGAVLFFTITAPWLLPDIPFLVPIQLVIGAPGGAVFYHLVMKEFHGEFDGPPRRRRSGTSSSSSPQSNSDT